ncbi:MAG: Secretion system C-terminal sorting domain, partial [Bacteroidota bacterium]
DFDGSTELTHSVAVIFKNSLVSFNIYPNPVNDFIDISFNQLPETDLQIKILDDRGSEIVRKNYSKEELTSTVRIKTLSFSSGIYTLKINDQSGKINAVKKFVKQ